MAWCADRSRGLALALVGVLLGVVPAVAQAPAGGGAGGQSGGMLLDRVVAVVNDEAVTLSEIQEEGQPVVRKIFQDFIGPERDRRLEEAEKLLMEDLIDRRLMIQVAKREGMLPSAAEINSALEEIKRNNNATDDAQFRALLKSEGLTVEQVRRSIGERLAIGRLLARQVRSTIIIGEDELTKYYEANPDKFKRNPRAEIRYIVFPVPPGGEEAPVRARAEEARARIATGEDFAQVAQQVASSGGGHGGDLMTVHRGELAPEIEAAAFGTQAGGVSPLIRTSAGWYLIKVERIMADPVTPFAEARDAIRDQLIQDKFEDKRKEWLANLRAKSHIQILTQTSTLHTEAKQP
ncbi:MAG TPA: peptidyl-prolyl cis-trans isomerase [Candidatus Methylomirabilis sp.]|nr:peptidyl-prolyl cis-trans isomerase [Candidatus Methylomirabilis sp.]